MISCGTETVFTQAPGNIIIDLAGLPLPIAMLVPSAERQYADTFAEMLSLSLELASDVLGNDEDDEPIGSRSGGASVYDCLAAPEDATEEESVRLHRIRDACERSPRFKRAVERRFIKRYERATGETAAVGGLIDWGKLSAFFASHAAMLQMLLSAISLLLMFA